MGRASVIAVLLLSPAALARADGEPISSVWRQLEPLPGGRTIMALTHAGGRLVGVAGGRGVAFTADGVLWSAHDAGPCCGAYALAWNGQELAAVGAQDVGTSHDGLEWEVDYIPDSKAQLDDVVWAGDHWAAVGSWSGGPPGGALTAVRSPGERWHFRWHSEAPGLRSLAWNGEILVALGGSSSWSSVDGLTWVYETSVLDVAPNGLRDIVWTGEHFVAVGEGAVALSEDGREWSGITLPNLSFRQVVWTGTELIGPPAVSTTCVARPSTQSRPPEST